MSKLENSTFEHVVGIHFSVDFFHFSKRRISYSFFFLGDVLFVSEGVFFGGSLIFHCSCRKLLCTKKITGEFR